MSSPQAVLSLRLPVELYAELRDYANRNGQSMNTATVQAVQQLLGKPVAEPVTREMWTADFTALEERVLAMVAGDKPGLEQVLELRIDGADKVDLEKLKAYFDRRPSLSDLYHSGGIIPPGATFRMGEGTILAGTGRGLKDQPEIQRIPEPDGGVAILEKGEKVAPLDWDGPLSEQAGGGLTWTKNTGHRPVAAEVLVDVKRRDGSVVCRRYAGTAWWGFDMADSDFDILEWRLASIELQPRVDGGADA